MIRRDFFSYFGQLDHPPGTRYRILQIHSVIHSFLSQVSLNWLANTTRHANSEHKSSIRIARKQIFFTDAQARLLVIRMLAIKSTINDHILTDTRYHNIICVSHQEAKVRSQFWTSTVRATISKHTGNI